MSRLLRALLLALVIPCVIWLVFNGPDLRHTANLFFVAIIVLKFYWLVWGRYLFGLFGGDRFTYGGVALGISVFAFGQSLLWGLYYFLLFPLVSGASGWKEFRDIPNWMVGYLSLWLLLNLAISHLTSRHVAPLPKASERRAFEQPDTGEQL